MMLVFHIKHILILIFLSIFLKCAEGVLFVKNYIRNGQRNLSRQAFLISYIVMIWFYQRSLYLLMTSVDIEKNPGPRNFHDGFFNFCHWNLNSVPAHNYIRISQLQAYTALHNLHVIALSETARTASNTSDKITIDGYIYTVLHRDLPQNTTHGGVLIFHKDDLALKPRPDLENHPNVLASEINILYRGV